jgi:hypothetical protein
MRAHIYLPHITEGNDDVRREQSVKASTEDQSHGNDKVMCVSQTMALAADPNAQQACRDAYAKENPNRLRPSSSFRQRSPACSEAIRLPHSGYEHLAVSEGIEAR